MATSVITNSIQISEDRDVLRLAVGAENCQAKVTRQAQQSTLIDWQGPELTNRARVEIIDELFWRLDASQLSFEGPAAKAFSLDHPVWQTTPQGARLSREGFYQAREFWLDNSVLPICPEEWTTTAEIQHPRRPTFGDQLLYSRRVPMLDQTVSLRQARPDVDGERFHRWQNLPRVAAFWEYPFSREKLDDMLRDRREDPHSLPLIMQVDGEAIGYFEAYYVVEDRLGPYCEAGPFDQGFHLLVGEEPFLGSNQAPIWLNSISHFLFLQEPRTRSLFGEPRADNQGLLRHLQATTWENLGEFDFPHKRSALLRNRRQNFFRNTRL